MVHQRSADEGHLVTAITGIPYFYRQFGYEYALDLGGKRTTYLTLFGHRSIDELRHAFPDVWVNDKTGYVLKALFPARASFVLPL